MKLQPAQYQDLKKFLNFFATRFLDIQRVSPEKRPIAILEAMEAKAPSRAADGLMMAINDCIEQSMSWEVGKVTAFDAELRISGIITLTELRRRYSRQYSRVVKRGHIKTVDEYYLLKGVLDGGSSEMEIAEQENLSQIIELYERKLIGRGI